MAGDAQCLGLTAELLEHLVVVGVLQLHGSFVFSGRRVCETKLKVCR